MLFKFGDAGRHNAAAAAAEIQKRSRPSVFVLNFNAALKMRHGNTMHKRDGDESANVCAWQVVFCYFSSVVPLCTHSKRARVNGREQRQKAKTVFALKFNLFVENAEPIVLNFSFVVTWNLLGDCREHQIKEVSD